MIDLHAHILHGVDDGPQSASESMCMAQAYTENGYHTVAATPHMVPGTAWMPSADWVTAQVADLNRAIRDRGLSLTVVPGMEIALDPSIPDLIDAGRLLPLGNTACLLIEPPFQQLPPGWEQTVFAILAKGNTVLLAHPERCLQLARHTDTIGRLVNAGVYLQVNWGSLLGQYGRDGSHRRPHDTAERVGPLPGNRQPSSRTARPGPAGEAAADLAKSIGQHNVGPDRPGKSDRGCCAANRWSRWTHPAAVDTTGQDDRGGDGGDHDTQTRRMQQMRSRPNTDNRWSQTLFRLTITVILAALGSWAVYHHWPLRWVDHIDDRPTARTIRRLDGYPAAHFAQGMQAWHQQQPARAADSFRRAVALDVLFFDAWIKLAEAEAAMGHVGKAKDILDFATRLTDRVYRYLWPQMLLAHELGVDAPVYDGVNYLLSNKVLVQDALQLLHTHLNNDAASVVAVLAPVHLPAYLDWTMRWGMSEESQVVWQAMTAGTAPDREIALRYAHFLLNHKKIIPSIAIWRDYTGSVGLTNPGFESEITGQGFDWRHWGEQDGKWEVKRIGGRDGRGRLCPAHRFRRPRQHMPSNTFTRSSR